MHEVITFEQYCAQHGAQWPSDAGMHARGHASDTAWRRSMAALSREIDKTAARRLDLKQEYDAKVELGEIRSPTALEQLQRAAGSHPDLASTQAAIRVLQKRLARQSA